MEKTLMSHFCAGSTLKIMLDSPTCPSILKDFEPLMQFYRADNLSDSLIEKKVSSGNKSSELSLKLDSDLKQKLQELTGISCSEAKFFKRHRFNHITYSITTESYSNSIIHLAPLGCKTSAPGVIRSIFIPLEISEVFLAIHFFKKACGIYDPFTQYADFGATIWSQSLEPNVVVIKLSSLRELPQAILRPWGNDFVVIKEVNKMKKV
jgi:hypothetical protein